MTILRQKRSPLGVYYRSPLGVRGRETLTIGWRGVFFRSLALRLNGEVQTYTVLKTSANPSVDSYYNPPSHQISVDRPPGEGPGDYTVWLFNSLSVSHLIPPDFITKVWSENDATGGANWWGLVDWENVDISIGQYGGHGGRRRWNNGVEGWIGYVPTSFTFNSAGLYGGGQTREEDFYSYSPKIIQGGVCIRLNHYDKPTVLGRSVRVTADITFTGYDNPETVIVPFDQIIILGEENENYPYYDYQEEHENYSYAFQIIKPASLHDWEPGGTLVRDAESGLGVDTVHLNIGGNTNQDAIHPDSTDHKIFWISPIPNRFILTEDSISNIAYEWL